MKRKDALTDAVEALQAARDQKPPQGQNPAPKAPRQVVNEAGETVTLGLGKSRTLLFSNKKKPLELSPSMIRAIERGIEDGVRAGFEGFAEEMTKALKEALSPVFEEIKKDLNDTR